MKLGDAVPAEDAVTGESEAVLLLLALRPDADTVTVSEGDTLGERETDGDDVTEGVLAGDGVLARRREGESVMLTDGDGVDDAVALSVVVVLTDCDPRVDTDSVAVARGVIVVLPEALGAREALAPSGGLAEPVEDEVEEGATLRLSGLPEAKELGMPGDAVGASVERDESEIVAVTAPEREAVEETEGATLKRDDAEAQRETLPLRVASATLLVGEAVVVELREGASCVPLTLRVASGERLALGGTEKVSAAELVREARGDAVVVREASGERLGEPAGDTEVDAVLDLLIVLEELAESDTRAVGVLVLLATVPVALARVDAELLGAVLPELDAEGERVALEQGLDENESTYRLAAGDREGEADGLASVALLEAEGLGEAANDGVAETEPTPLRDGVVERVALKLAGFDAETARVVFADAVPGAREGLGELVEDAEGERRAEALGESAAVEDAEARAVSVRELHTEADTPAESVLVELVLAEAARVAAGESEVEREGSVEAPALRVPFAAGGDAEAAWLTDLRGLAVALAVPFADFDAVGKTLCEIVSAGERVAEPAVEPEALLTIDAEDSGVREADGVVSAESESAERALSDADTVEDREGSE